MSSRAMRGVAMAMPVVMVLFTTGCGSSSGKVTAPNTPKQIAADKALAKRAVLTPADLPTSYKATPHKESSDSDLPPAVERNFLSCTGLPKSFIDDKSNDQPNAHSADFSKGTIGIGTNATAVESSVTIDRSSENIEKPLSHLTGTKAAKCFQPFFAAVLAQALGDQPGVEVSPVSVVALDAGEIGDQLAAFQGRVTVSGGPGSIDFEFNIYFARSGRAIATLFAAGFNQPFDQDLAESLLQMMVDRLQDA